MGKMIANQKQRIITLENIKGSLGIFEGTEGEELKSLDELLNILEEVGSITLDSFGAFTVYKNFNSFGWNVYETKEDKGKFGKIIESEQMLIFKEVMSEDEYDEDIESVSPIFEIKVSSIDEYEYDPLNQILTLYLENEISLRLYYV